MKTKRLLALILSVVTTVSLFGCGSERPVDNVTSESEIGSEVPESTETETSEAVEIDLSYPIKDSQGLSIYSIDFPLPNDKNDYNDVPFWQGLQKNTGVTLDVEFPVTGSSYEQAFNLLLTEDELPDIIFNYLSRSVIEQLLEDGVIYDLTEYLPVYAPDYWAFLNDPYYESVKNEVTTSSGQIACFMAARQGLDAICYVGPVVRKDWLDECGLDEPVTIADWEEMLIAFKERYGATMSFTKSYFHYSKALASGFGGHGGFRDCQYYVEDGVIKCAQLQPEWKEQVETFNRWYEMGLIDPDALVVDNSMVRSKTLNNEVGASVAAMSQITNWINDAEAENTGAEWVGVGYPRTAPGEPTTAILANSTLAQNFCAVITTSCPEEKLIEALRFLNYGYTEEGHMYWNFGTEGVSYEMDAEGNIAFTDLLKNDPNGLSVAVTNYTGTSGAGICIQDRRLVRAKNHEVASEAVKKWVENTNAMDYEVPTLSKGDAQDEYNDIQNALNTKVEEMAVKFMRGEVSLDKYDDFIKELHEIGVDRIIEILQTAYDAEYK